MMSKQPHPPEPTGTPADGGIDEPAFDRLDEAAIARLAELDPTGKGRLLERVLQAFQTSAGRLRPQLDAARHGGDTAAIRLVVHTLKSSSASIGALRLSQLCAEVETSIRLGDGQSIEAPLDALNLALDGALRAIEVRLEGPA